MIVNRNFAARFRIYEEKWNVVNNFFFFFCTRKLSRSSFMRKGERFSRRKRRSFESYIFHRFIIGIVERKQKKRGQWNQNGQVFDNLFFRILYNYVRKICLLPSIIFASPTSSWDLTRSENALSYIDASSGNFSTLFEVLFFDLSTGVTWNEKEKFL